MRKLANGWFLPPPLELGLLLALLLLLPQAAPRRANPTTSAPTLSSHVHRWLRVTRYLPIWTFPPRARPKHLLGGRCYPAPLIRCDDEERALLGEKPDAGAALPSQIVRLRLLEDTADPVALRGVQDAATAEPERDVGRLPLVAVGDEVARPQLVGRERSSGRLLLVGVARDEQAEPPVGHVNEAGAVDAPLGHAAPEVRRAEGAAGRLFAPRHVPAGMARGLLEDAVAADARLAWSGDSVRLATPPGHDLPLERATYVVVDLETTGLRPGTCRICEIGAVRVRELELGATFQTLANPGIALGRAVASLTGLRDGELRHAPPAAEAVRRVPPLPGGAAPRPPHPPLGLAVP